MSVSASVTPISDAACALKPLAWFDGALIEADSVQAGLTTHQADLAFYHEFVSDALQDICDTFGLELVDAGRVE